MSSLYNPKTQLGYGRAIETIDYIPVSAVNAGDPVIIDGVLYIAPYDIAAGALGALCFSGGIWQGNKAAGAWTNGNPVYWDTAASPNVSGIGPSGAYTQAATATATFAGYAVLSPPTQAAAATGDQFGWFVKAVAPAIGSSGAYAAITAAGSAQGNATPLILGTNNVTGGNGTKGVILPAGVTAAATVDVMNTGSTGALKVYPATGNGTINALSAGAAISMGNATSATFKCFGSDVWGTIPTVPS